VGTEGEHCERDKRLVSVEPERDVREQTDLGVRGPDEPLREAGIERSIDRVAVGCDLALEVPPP
jgi:hypothetical protein